MAPMWVTINLYLQHIDIATTLLWLAVIRLLK
jgi:hypothetical protein